MSALRIIFMGTPEFAVPALRVLVENKFNVVAVVTAPDKPTGRGQKMSSSQVKEYATSAGIPVLQPVNLKADSFLEELRSYKANLQVVVAFRMLPEAVWSMPAMGTFNLHASLLPKYRGAAPINWAIINGEKETGVTTFFLQHAIDTGHIIFQEKEPIHDDDNAGTLYNRLMEKGGALVLKTVQAIESGNCPSIPQRELATPVHAPKIFKETCQINWNQTSVQVRNFIRGLSQYPGAWTMINDKTFKIYKVQLTNDNHSAEHPWVTDHKTYLHFRTGDGWVAVESLQAEGKKRMTVKEFLLGNRL